MTGGGACLTGPARSPGSRAARHSGRSLRAAPLGELPEKGWSGAGAGWGRELGAGKGCWRVCETGGVLEEQEKVLDPSLTCVTLAVMSPLWVCFPSGKMGGTEWPARFHLYCESWPMREVQGRGLGRVTEVGVLQAGPGLHPLSPHLGRGCCWSGCADGWPAPGPASSHTGSPGSGS